MGHFGKQVCAATGGKQNYKAEDRRIKTGRFHLVLLLESKGSTILLLVSRSAGFLLCGVSDSEVPEIR
jgi:hypothetical protein